MNQVEQRDPNKQHVLCIDDDNNLLNALTRNLEWADIEVSNALNGVQGIWMTTMLKPNLIITDLKMPLGDGEYVIDHIMADPSLSDTPIFVLTGVHNEHIDQKLLARGVKEIFRKPVDIQELIDTIAKYIPLEEESTFDCDIPIVKAATADDSTVNS